MNEIDEGLLVDRVFEKLERALRGSWIAQIQIELVNRRASGLLVTIDNYEPFKGMTPAQAAVAAIKHQKAYTESLPVAKAVQSKSKRKSRK